MAELAAESTGRPSSSHLPSTSSSTVFCHSCLANQMLITNMLANYLPDDSVCSESRDRQSLKQTGPYIPSAVRRPARIHQRTT